MNRKTRIERYSPIKYTTAQRALLSGTAPKLHSPEQEKITGECNLFKLKLLF